MRKILIKLLCRLLKIEVKEKQVDEILTKDEIKFVSPFDTKEIFEKSESLTEFINNLKKDVHTS